MKKPSIWTAFFIDVAEGFSLPFFFYTKVREPSAQGGCYHPPHTCWMITSSRREKISSTFSVGSGDPTGTFIAFLVL